MTTQTLAVLAAMIEDPTKPWYGLELAEGAQLKSGTIYPALARLERAGWVESYWEDADPRSEGRPRRRLYLLTGKGVGYTREAIDAHLRRMRVGQTSPRPGLASGGSVA